METSLNEQHTLSHILITEAMRYKIAWYMITNITSSWYQCIMQNINLCCFIAHTCIHRTVTVFHF